MGLFDIFKGNSEEIKKKQIIFCLMSTVSFLDEDFSQAEKRYMTVWGKSLSAKERAAISNALEQYSQEQLIEMANELKWEDKQELLDVLLSMAAADGEIIEKEAGYIMAIAAMIGADMDHFRKMMIDSYDADKALLDKIWKQVTEGAKNQDNSNSKNNGDHSIKGFRETSEEKKKDKIVNEAQGDSMFCSKCGAQNSSSSNFCTNCGESIIT